MIDLILGSSLDCQSKEPNKYHHGTVSWRRGGKSTVELINWRYQLIIKNWQLELSQLSGIGVTNSSE